MRYETSITLRGPQGGPNPSDEPTRPSSESDEDVVETAVTLDLPEGVEVESMAEVQPKFQVFAKARVVRSD